MKALEIPRTNTRSQSVVSKSKRYPKPLVTERITPKTSSMKREV